MATFENQLPHLRPIDLTEAHTIGLISPSRQQTRSSAVIYQSDSSPQLNGDEVSSDLCCISTPVYSSSSQNLTHSEIRLGKIVYFCILPVAATQRWWITITLQHTATSYAAASYIYRHVWRCRARPKLYSTTTTRSRKKFSSAGHVFKAIRGAFTG